MSAKKAGKHGDSDEDFTVDDKVKKMKNKLLKTRKKKEKKDTFDEDDLQSDVDSEVPMTKKPARAPKDPKEPKGKGRKKKDQPFVDPNKIKTSNNLIGDIERDELYGEDELDIGREAQEDLKKEELVFEESKPSSSEDRKSKDQFLMKMKTKKEQMGEKDAV